MEKNMIDKIAKIINSVRPEIKIIPGQETELFGVLDSLDIIFIVDELESQLSITIDADQIIPENFASLSALVVFVKSCIR